MAQYPGTERDIRIPADLLVATTCGIFRRCGMGAADAALLADSLTDADLRGIHSHGVLRVPDYVAKLTREGVDPRGEPRLASARRSALVVDCGNNMGQIGLAFAMHQAIERARATGIAMAVVQNSNHCGAMGYFAAMALDRDMIGLAGTNAIPTMAPWGGTDKIVGINPLAVAIPGGREGPFLLDISFGETAHGKIRVYAQKGEPLPPGWAFDAEGRPTTDAVRALDGLIRPIGGHKGVGMGMAIGMLSTLLSSASYGTGLGDMVDGPRPGHDGHFCIAIDVAAFTDVAALKAKVDAILAEVRAGRRAPGIERLLAPGEMEFAMADENRRNGIPLNRETIAGILRAAAELGADASGLGDVVAAADRAAAASR